MKKSIAVLLALVLMMTVVFFGCGKKEDSEEVNKDETSQQAPGEGSTQSNTPAEGNNDVTGATDTTGTTDITGTSDATDTTAATDPTGTTNTTDVTGATKPSKPDFAPSKPDDSQQTVTHTQSSHKIDKYRQIFSSGTYSMTIITVTDGVEDMPVDFACKNGNIRMSLSMDGNPAIMIYRADNNTAYVLLEIFGKFYTELTEELIGEEIDFSHATKGFQIPNDAVITSGTGTFDGKTVAAETVVSSEKTTVFYFDNNGTLLGTEVTEDGVVSATKISNISTTVDDSVFEIPKEYNYMDLSWLMNMA